MDFYLYNIIGFVLVNAFLAHRQQLRDGRTKDSRLQGSTADREKMIVEDAVNWQFKKLFLPVYLMVSGADWLQGPYIYTLYKDQKGLSEETVSRLFATGFLAAGISAFFVGSLADRFGRRCACMVFCGTYSISCLTVLSNRISVLFMGRILGGLSSTLMYSVFESWMVTEYHRQRLDEAGGSLDDIFGIMTTLNGVVAIVAGLFSQAVVLLTGTQAAPFMFAVLLLSVAFGAISKRWSENYGDSVNESRRPGSDISEKEGKNGFQLILHDKRLWALCTTSCFFEGSMYLWIIFKFPTLQLSRETSGGKGTDLPFGFIFAALMCSMMLGSLLFTYHSSLPAGRGVVSSSTMLMATLMVASICFVVPVVCRQEVVTFWCFCIFEICCGIYFPSMAHLKEKYVDDGVRAKVYAVLRVPLNIFVVVVFFFISIMTNGGARDRENVFIICSGALVLASAAVGTLLR